MTCQILISDLSGVESPSAATARMHLLRRFSRYGPGKLAPHADGPCVCASPSLLLRSAAGDGCATACFLAGFARQTFCNYELVDWHGAAPRLVLQRRRF